MTSQPRTTPKSPWYEEMHRAHQAFRRSSAALLETLQACRARPGQGQQDGLQVEFDAFARLLRRHFLQEEGGDLFLPEGATSISARRWVEQTREAHRDFESRIDQLSRELDAGPPTAEFERRLRALIDDLFEHELSEERLVQRMVFEEPDALDFVL